MRAAPTWWDTLGGRNAQGEHHNTLAYGTRQLDGPYLR